jgi:hypothetical protein
MVLTVKLHHLFHVHLTMLYQGLARAFDVQMDNLGGSPVVPVHGADSCFVMSCVVSVLQPLGVGVDGESVCCVN